MGILIKAEMVKAIPADFSVVPSMLELDGSYADIFNSSFISENTDFLTTYEGGCSVPVTNLPPVVSLIGAGTVVLGMGELYTEQGATSLDEDGDLTAGIVITDNIDNLTAGSYQVDYTSIDSQGASTVESRTVEVTQANVFTFGNGTLGTLTHNFNDSDTITTLGSLLLDVGIIAVDDLGSDVIGTVVVGGYTPSSSTYTLPIGTYTTTFDVTMTNGQVMPTLTVIREVVATPTSTAITTSTIVLGTFTIGSEVAVAQGGTGLVAIANAIVSGSPSNGQPPPIDHYKIIFPVGKTVTISRSQGTGYVGLEYYKESSDEWLSIGTLTLSGVFLNQAWLDSVSGAVGTNYGLFRVTQPSSFSLPSYDYELSLTYS